MRIKAGKEKKKKIKVILPKEDRRAYLLCAVPAVSSLVFLLSLMVTDGPVLIEKWGLYLFGNVEKFSLASVLLIVGYTVLWGYCGALFARGRVHMLKAVLTANALYIAGAALYTALMILCLFIPSSSEALSGIADVAGGISMGIISILTGYIYGLVSVNTLEVFIALLIGVGTFIVGYSIGASGVARENDKNK